MDKNFVKAVMDSDVSKSEKMRKLYYDGSMDIGDIAKELGVRYNFVYNVISNDVRMKGGALRKREKGESKKDKIVEMVKDGMECIDISRELKCNINMVYKYRKEMERGLIK